MSLDKGVEVMQAFCVGLSEGACKGLVNLPVTKFTDVYVNDS